MLSPKEAYDKLLETGERFDDPTQPWYPLGWYFNEQGILCSCLWRGFPTEYKEFVKP